MIKVKVEEHKTVSIMHLEGNLFIENLGAIIGTWEKLVMKHPHVIAMNCGKLERIDSSSIGTLVKFLNDAMNKNIKLVFYDLNPSIQQLFITTRLEKFFSITTGPRFHEKYFRSA